jgi:hypothetical protein
MGILYFSPEKRDFRKLSKLHAIKGYLGLDGPCKYVLTAKKGLFLGLLAAKRGFHAIRKTDYFELLAVLVAFHVCKLLSVRIFRTI